MAPVTRLLIIANFAVFGLQLVSRDALVTTFALWPIGHFSFPELHATVGFKIWQLVTCGFLHGSLVHIGLNMYALWMFGSDVERALGAKHYLALYFAALLSASCVQLAVVSLMPAGVYPTIGASGAVFGILLAFGLLFPRRTLVLLFPPIPMPAILFVILYGIIELLHGLFGTEAGVAHFAHLGGMLGAYPVLRHWRNQVSRSDYAPIGS
jgi:membrane associated rhomboid family serine protease